MKMPLIRRVSRHAWPPEAQTMPSAKPRARVAAWLATLSLGVVAGLGSGAGFAADQDGEDLAQQVYDRSDGDDLVTQGTMVLTGDRRREQTRDLYEYRLDGEDDESWQLIRFTSPANVANTGMITHNRPDGSSEQRLYLPAADRVRRISSDNRAGNFVQSDLYYEDLETRKPDQDEHRMIGEDEYHGTPVKLLESTPAEGEDSAYTRRVRWVDPQTLLDLRVDLYRGGETPEKRMEVQEIERIQGYWTVTRSTMTNLRDGTRTVIQIEEAIYDQGLPQDLFGSRALSNPAREERFRP